MSLNKGAGGEGAMRWRVIVIEIQDVTEVKVLVGVTLLPALW